MLGSVITPTYGKVAPKRLNIHILPLIVNEHKFMINIKTKVAFYFVIIGLKRLEVLILGLFFTSISSILMKLKLIKYFKFKTFHT